MISKVQEKDIISIILTEEDFRCSILNSVKVSSTIKDRPDLHKRDVLERFINILMGEVAEKIVIRWLQNERKFVKTSRLKGSGKPDEGFDIELRSKTGKALRCSIKSSLSYFKGPAEILRNFRLGSKKSELTDVNIQVYFWLSLNPPSNQERTTIPSIDKSAIFGWYGKNDLKKFEHYNKEAREISAQILEN